MRSALGPKGLSRSPVRGRPPSVSAEASATVKSQGKCSGRCDERFGSLKGSVSSPVRRYSDDLRGNKGSRKLYHVLFGA